MNQVVIYNFTIKAVSPVYFGTDKDGEIVLDSDDKPIILGNAIGGALRDYLKRTNIPHETILNYMGGTDDESKKDVNNFKPSSIYISDGEIKIGPDGIIEKEGTTVDPEYGTAKENHKYKIKYFPEGSEISFSIECDDWSKPEYEKMIELCPLELEKLIITWAQGIQSQNLLFGGQKSNGFGRFQVSKINKIAYAFKSTQDINEYIFNRNAINGQVIPWDKLDYYNVDGNDSVSISMAGQFLYGVYQGFAIPKGTSIKNELTGLLENSSQDIDKKLYYLPSTSIKGLIRNEIYLLIKRLIEDDELANKKCSELFGDTDKRGKLTFSDLQIKDGKEVNIKRSATKEGIPTYIKIDRLTGGAFHTAFKQQREIQGKATITFSLKTDTSDTNPYLFPLIYVLKRIGSGLVPIGGRTVIGLGEFSAHKVTVINGSKQEFEVNEKLSEHSRKLLEEYYNVFKRWCDNGYA